jgi:hypothetical protein
MMMQQQHQQGIFSARSFNNGAAPYRYPVQVLPHVHSGQVFTPNYMQSAVPNMNVVFGSGQSNFAHRYNASHNQSSVNVFSPRQNNLKPLQSLDDRVMRNFKSREMRDQQFKQRVKEIQTYSYKLLSPTNANNGYHV